MDKKQINSYQFKDIYQELKIDLAELGCIMLDVSMVGVPDFPAKKELYTSPNPKNWWIKGFVASENPHITLLYGLLKPGLEWKGYVDKVLESWNLESVEVDHVDYFDSPYEDEPYYCIIAHIKITPELLEGHQRLELLPHVNTFVGYKVHLVIAYIKKDEKTRTIIIDYYNQALKGKKLKIKGIDYGGKS